MISFKFKSLKEDDSNPARAQVFGTLASNKTIFSLPKHNSYQFFSRPEHYHHISQYRTYRYTLSRISACGTLRVIRQSCAGAISIHVLLVRTCFLLSCTACWPSVNAEVAGDFLLVLVWLLTRSSKSNDYNMRLSGKMGS